MAPGPVWTGAENLAPTGIRSRDRPARSQSLYRKRYLAHTMSTATETTVSGQSNSYMVKVLASAVPDTVRLIAGIGGGTK